MAAKAPRYALHCHHAREENFISRIGPFELIDGPKGFKERAAYIKAQKPKAEVETRLRLFRLLTVAESRRVHAVFAATATARKAYNDARATARKAYNDATATARKAYDDATATAWKAYDDATATARKAYDDATATARKAYHDATATAWKAAEQLHRELCVADCPWDGKTIFPEAPQ